MGSHDVRLDRAPSVFRKSLPVLITGVVNKSGSIGLSLLPMLLVDGGYSTAESSLAMSFVKGSTIVATLASGWFSDTLGLRFTVLGSFLLAALGLAALPIQLGYAVLLISGVVAQLGITSTNSTLRLLLVRTVERHHQREALGWMRLVNNLGQVLSFGLATMTATLGARVLIWFDSLTSLLAFIIGGRILPRAAQKGASSLVELKPSAQESGARSWWTFAGCTLLLAGWSFLYEFFMTGVAGKLKLSFPDEGLRIFSLLMVVNTVLCAALAVVAARVLKRVVPSLVIGAMLATSGVALAAHSLDSLPMLFVSVLLLTLGEIVYGALGQFLLIRSVPASTRENSLYSSALLFSNFSRMLAAALAFPLLVHGSGPVAATWAAVVVGLMSLTVLAIGAARFRELGEG